MSACPHAVQNKDLCQRKWLFLLGIDGSQCDDLCEIIKMLGNIIQFRNESSRSAGSLNEIVEFFNDRIFDETAAKTASWLHNPINVKDLYFASQQLLMETYDYTANASSVIFGFNSNIGVVEERYEQHLFFLNKAFPCSRIIFFTNSYIQKSHINVKTKPRNANKLQTLFPHTTLFETFYNRKVGAPKVNKLLEFIGIQHCTFTENRTFEGKCISTLI
jgi:hypothetical protein